jgi:iron complex transport system ATP-binding protein
VTALTFDGVTVHYGNRVAVHNFSDEVAPGEWLCLIGPNGAGKSTLLRTVLQQVAHGGEVRADGVALGHHRPRRRAQLVAHVPQVPVLPEEMTVGDYVLLGRTPYIGYFGLESRRDRQIAAQAMVDLDLDAMAQRPLAELSGGERQRLVIARALAQQAPVLLLDEPTSALDIGHQQQALELVDRLRRRHGLTVVSAMHDLTLAGLYADRLALLHRGSCVASGRAADVLRAETLSEFYGVSVRVHHESDGTVVVVPRRTGDGV